MVLTVNIGDSVEGIRNVFKELNVSLPVVRDPDETSAGAYKVEVLATNYLVAPDGTIARRDVGYDDRAVREGLERLLPK